MSTASPLDKLFKGRHFLGEVILVSVRWYLEYKLSSRDIVRLMAEREISLAHTTILRWVRRYAPEFEKKWQCYAHLIGPSWRVDESVSQQRLVRFCMT
jgi:transposase-like protein